MCCGDGEVCANAMGGAKCWPKRPLSEDWLAGKPVATAASMHATVNDTITSASLSSSSKTLHSGSCLSATKSSGASRNVGPWLLYILLFLPFALAGFTSSPVNPERDISEVKNFQDSHQDVSKVPTSTPCAILFDPLNVGIDDGVIMKNEEGDPSEKVGGGHGGRGGRGGGRGGSKSNSSASALATETMETFSGLKTGVVHVAVLIVLVVVVYPLV